MKKLLISASLFLILSFFLIYHRDYFKTSPFNSKFELDYPSFSIMDSRGFFYVIDRGTSRIVKIDASGELAFVIEGGKRKPGSFYYSGKIAVDDQDRLYVYNFMPNMTDGFLEREEILRYFPDGRFDRVAVSYEYGSESKKRRESIIRFYVKGDEIYYYYKEGNLISLFVTHQTQKATLPLFTVEVKDDVVDIAGFKPGQIYLTTKKGQILRIEKDLRLTEPALPENFLVKPAGIEMNRQGHIYAADMVNQKVIKFDPEKPEKAVAVLQKEGKDNMLLEFLSLSPQDDLVIVDKFHHQMIARSPEGITLKISEAYYSKTFMLVKVILWLLALLDALLLILTLYLFYMRVMNQKIPLMIKQLVIFTPIIIGSVLYTSNRIYQNLYEKYEQEFHYKLLNVVSLGSRLLDGNALEKISLPKDFMGPEYEKIDRQAHDLINDNQDPWNESFYLVIYQVKDGVFYINYTLSGFFGVLYPYFAVRPEHDQAFEKGTVSMTRYSDDQGSYLAAVAPIRNKDGQIVAVLDMGIDRVIFEELNSKYKSSLIMGILFSVSIFILIFVGITYLLLTSIQKLRNATHKIINGNLDIDIQIRSKDEIEELGKDFNKMSRQLKEYITRIVSLNKANARFVPAEFLKFLNKESIVDIELGDQTQQEMTVLFTDIRSFTTLSETMTPQENFNFLNSYLKRVAPVIRTHHGFIDKYIGDAIMALFSGSPLNCIRAAVEMQKMVSRYNEHRTHKGYQPIEIGIGIHTGNLMLGIIGEEERIDGTVISDAVNLASRLEGLTKMYGAPIIFSGNTLSRILEGGEVFPYAYRFVDRVKVKGKKEAVDLYEILAAGKEACLKLKLQNDREFQNAVALYRKGRIEEAKEIFEALMVENHEDHALYLYLKRCEKLIKFGLPEEWDGVEKLDEK